MYQECYPIYTFFFVFPFLSCSCQGHSVLRCLQRGSSYLRMSISPEWVVLVKLYAMKVLWLYRYEHGVGCDKWTITNRS
jgi:hypothetical protein